MTPVHSGGSCSSFAVKPNVRDQLTTGKDVIDVDDLKTRYPHLEPIALSKYSYTDVKMSLGQDVFHAIHPLEYFESDPPPGCRPVIVGLGTEWTPSVDYGSVFDMLQSCYPKKSTIVHSPTDSAAGTTLNRMARTNKWIPVAQPTRERRRNLMKPDTTMGPDT